MFEAALHRKRIPKSMQSNFFFEILPLELINSSSGSVAFFGAFLFFMHLTLRSNCSVASSFGSSSPLVTRKKFLQQYNNVIMVHDNVLVHVI